MKIIALIDASAYSLSVCDYSAWIASRSNAVIDLVHVLPHLPSASATPNLSGSIGIGARTALLTELADLDAENARVAQKRARLLAEDAKRRVQSADASLEVHCRLRHGDLVETVAELESEADVIVIGKRGENAQAAPGHLGSNLERIVRASHKPVLVVNREFHPVTHPLIAFDGGKSVIKAVDHLCASQVFGGLDCTLLSVGEANGLDAAAARLQNVGYSASIDRREGVAEDEIASAVTSGHHDLLIMGAYGHSRIRNLIIGSTTSQMIQTSGIPLLLFR